MQEEQVGMQEVGRQAGKSARRQEGKNAETRNDRQQHAVQGFQGFSRSCPRDWMNSENNSGWLEISSLA